MPIHQRHLAAAAAALHCTDDPLMHLPHCPVGTVSMMVVAVLPVSAPHQVSEVDAPRIATQVAYLLVPHVIIVITTAAFTAAAAAAAAAAVAVVMHWHQLGWAMEGKCNDSVQWDGDGVTCIIGSKVHHDVAVAVFTKVLPQVVGPCPRWECINVNWQTDSWSIRWYVAIGHQHKPVTQVL